jgi:hypothetical protein
MSTEIQNTNGRKWVKHVGAAGLPDGFDKEVPLGGQAIEKARRGFQSGTAWTRLENGTVLRCDPIPMKAGAGGDSTPGDYLGDATILQGAYAENATGNSWTSLDPAAANQGANDVYDLVTPGTPGDVSGITDTVYVQFRDPPNAEIWKYEPANGAGYFKANSVDQTKLVPQANLSNGAPKPGSAPGGVTATLKSAAPWLLGIAAVALGGVIVYAVVEHQKSSGETRVAGHHHAHDNPRRGPKRDAHGRFKKKK